MSTSVTRTDEYSVSIVESTAPAVEPAVVAAAEPECTDWAPPPRKKKAPKVPKPSYGDVRVADADAPLLSSMNAGKGESSLIEAEPAKPEGKKALCISILTLLLSIPALIGAWCWPALVIGILGGTVTASARSMGHSISFGITLAMMIGITSYTFYCTKRRRGVHFHVYGPTYLMCLASILVLADLMRHVLQDANIWPEPGSRQYNPGCHDETFKCLSSIGWIFTIFCTYTGFAMLMFATMWNADLIGKLAAMREKWRELRGTTQ